MSVGIKLFACGVKRFDAILGKVGKQETMGHIDTVVKFDEIVVCRFLRGWR